MITKTDFQILDFSVDFKNFVFQKKSLKSIEKKSLKSTEKSKIPKSGNHSSWPPETLLVVIVGTKHQKNGVSQRFWKKSIVCSLFEGVSFQNIGDFQWNIEDFLNISLKISNIPKTHPLKKWTYDGIFSKILWNPIFLVVCTYNDHQTCFWWSGRLISRYWYFGILGADG